MHVAIILDGNRRYAKKIGKQPWEGHTLGAEKLKELLGWCRKHDVNELTLYTFSIENFNRPEQEKKVLFELFRNYLKGLKGDELKKNNLSLRFLGRLEMFPADLQKEMSKVEEMTKENGNILNFCLAYGGRQEIVDSVKKIAASVKEGKISPSDIDEKMITENLYLQHDPDLIIRPGGEKRISNFLLWQGQYAEWSFTDKLWPEFTEKDFIEALAEYTQRQRRYGT